jgi:hypothetical protein
MKKQWYPIYDPELGTCTMIAPRTGHMVVSTTDYRRTPMRAALRLALGTSATTRGHSEFRRAQIIDSNADTDGTAAGPDAASIRRVATLCLRLLPLSVAIALMHLLFPPAPATGISVDEAVRRTAAAFGRRSRQDCLLVSLCRHTYLRRLGISSKILLGAQVPTEKMHAWVQIGEHPVLECPDVMVHYQACVAYL